MIDAATVHSIYLQTFWKLSKNAHAALAATHASAWFWEFVKGAGMYPFFFNEMRFWYLLRCCCVLIYFFFDRLSILDLCGESVDSVPAAVCDSTATWLCFPWWEARNEVSGDFWAKKVEFFPCEIAASVCGTVRRRRNRLVFPDIPLWLKHFFLGIAAHRAAWNLNIVTNSLNNTVMRWEGERGRSGYWVVSERLTPLHSVTHKLAASSPNLSRFRAMLCRHGPCVGP